MLNRKFRKKSFSGFTLIELLIAIAIIGILATTLPGRYIDMLKKQQQAMSKYNLGVFRSSTAIYYADNEGVWPYQDADLGGTKILLAEIATNNRNAWVPLYLNVIPYFESGVEISIKDGQKDIGIIDDSDADFDSNSRLVDESYAAVWLYFRDSGQWYINCSDTDKDDRPIAAW
ncbi:MAG: prepilin-type N-terminal cleavage/methylation domain-containing protein [bacterium]